MSSLNLGNALEQKGDFATARRLYEDALRIQRKVYGDRHPRVAQALSDLAEMFLTLREPGRAEPPAREALGIRREALSPTHADLGRSLSILGAVRLAAGSPEEAEPLLRSGLEVLRKALPQDHWRIGEAESRLGACLAALGRSREAEPLLDDGYRRVLRGRGSASLKTQAALARLRAFRPA
ncbi:MAG TPA: tetratricopeptide repeat protein, partial [Candidatus Polarisedimenticolaceae bacterium]|nr:tetratricopeptide repeat protein [Candidatus Polarisedimenticolaceae bacterium]